MIIQELKSSDKGRFTCKQLCDLLRHRGKKVTYATVWEHLEKLSKSELGILIKDDRPGRDNERYYSLSEAAKFQLEYDIFEGVKSKREDPRRRAESQAVKNKKIRTLLLFQAAAGSSRWAKAKGKWKGGLLRWYNPETREYELLESYSEEGVTATDIIQNKDHSNEGLFSHVKFNEEDVEKCYKKFVSDYKDKGYSDIIMINPRQNGEAYHIKSENMCNLIMGCASMLSNESIENILKLSILKSSSFRPMLARESKSSKSKLIRDSLEWYLESFGQERFNNLYAQTMVTKMKCKLNNEDLYRQLEQKAFRDRDDYGLSNEAMYNNLYSTMLKEVEAITATESVRLRKKRKKKEQTILNKQIERLKKDATERDLSLLYNYHCRVICDKQDIHKWLPEKRFEFLRKVSESKDKGKETNDDVKDFLKYRSFRDMLLGIVYPKFLEEEHKRRPELVNFVKGLPDNK